MGKRARAKERARGDRKAANEKKLKSGGKGKHKGKKYIFKIPIAAATEIVPSTPATPEPEAVAKPKLAPLRNIVSQALIDGVDYDELECGHKLPLSKDAKSKRRCPQCAG